MSDSPASELPLQAQQVRDDALREAAERILELHGALNTRRRRCFGDNVAFGNGLKKAAMIVEEMRAKP